MKNLKCFIVLIFISVSLCVFAKSPTDSDKLNVYVSIPFAKYLVTNICGDYADVKVILPENANPETYEVTKSQIKELKNSDIVVKMGQRFEKTFKEKLPKNTEIIELSGYVSSRVWVDKIHVHDISLLPPAKSKNPNIIYSRQRGSWDTNCWMSVENAKTMAKYLYEHLIKCEKLQSKSEQLAQNYEMLSKTLNELEEYAKAKLNGFEGKAIMSSHLAYGYLADDFNIESSVVDVYGKDPSEESIKETIDYAKQNNITTIFVQPQFTQEPAKKVAESLNGKIVELNPFAEDYETMIKNVCDKLAESFH